MRPLTPEETKILFEKLSKYIGDNIKLLIDRDDGAYCFRLDLDHLLEYLCSNLSVYEC